MKFIQYFLSNFGFNLNIFFRFPHIFIRMLFHIWMFYPYANFRTPPLNTPLITSNNLISLWFFFVIVFERKKLQMRLSRSILRFLQWRHVGCVVLFEEIASSQKWKWQTWYLFSVHELSFISIFSERLIVRTESKAPSKESQSCRVDSVTFWVRPLQLCRLEGSRSLVTPATSWTPIHKRLSCECTVFLQYCLMFSWFAKRHAPFRVLCLWNYSTVFEFIVVWIEQYCPYGPPTVVPLRDDSNCAVGMLRARWTRAGVARSKTSDNQCCESAPKSCT